MDQKYIKVNLMHKIGNCIDKIICCLSKVLTYLVMKLVRDKNGTYSITQYIRFSSKANIFSSRGFFHVFYDIALSSSEYP